jgi:hypothetical protein
MVSVHFTAKGSGSGVPLELEFCQLITVIDARIYRVDQYLSRESAEQDWRPERVTGPLARPRAASRGAPPWPSATASG